MAIEIPGIDGQDQAELFDEDNTEGIDALQEGSTFEEIPDVYDATQRIGDADDELAEEFDAADFDLHLIDDEDLEEEDEVIDDDVYDETDEEDVGDPDLLDRVAARSRDEVDLEYQPDVDGRRGARGGAGGYEARGELDEDDLLDLGYADLEEEEEEEERAPPARNRSRAASREPKTFKAPPCSPVKVDTEQDAEHARPATEPMSEEACFDHLGDKVKPDEPRQEALIDEAVEETFPASDPIAPKHIT